MQPQRLLALTLAFSVSACDDAPIDTDAPAVTDSDTDAHGHTDTDPTPGADTDTDAEPDLVRPGFVATLSGELQGTLSDGLRVQGVPFTTRQEINFGELTGSTNNAGSNWFNLRIPADGDLDLDTYNISRVGSYNNDATNVEWLNGDPGRLFIDDENYRFGLDMDTRSTITFESVDEEDGVSGTFTLHIVATRLSDDTVVEPITLEGRFAW